jgi:hypothetical protein
MTVRLTRSKIALAALIPACLWSLYPSQAAPKVVKPKIGDCYLLNPTELNSVTSTKSAIACSKNHNAETFRVFKWSKPGNPSGLNELERRAFVESICKPSEELDEFLNSWSYKIPNPSQWKMGARFVRCDLNASISESETVTFQSWKGKKLKSN